MAANEYDDLLSVPKTPAPQMSAAPAAAPSEYDQHIDAAQTEQKANIQSSMYIAKAADPDRHAEIMALSKANNLPPNIIERNYDEVKQRDTVNNTDYDQIINKTPGLAKFLENPDNAALSKDDLNTLGRVDNAAGMLRSAKPTDSILNEPGELVQAVQTGWHDLNSSVWQLGGAYGFADPEMAATKAAAANKAAVEAQKKLPDYMKEFNEHITKESGDVSKAAQQFMGSFQEARNGEILKALKDFVGGGGMTVAETLDLIGANIVRPRGFTYMMAQSLPSMVPMLAGGAAGAETGALTGAAASVLAGPAAPAVAPFTTAAGGVAGMIGGTFAGTAPVEVGKAINASLTKRGVDITDAGQLRQAYANPQLMQEVRAEANRKGLTTSAIQALFMGVAGKIASKSVSAEVAAATGQEATSAIKTALLHATDTGVQAGGMSVSDAAGQYAEKQDIGKVDLGESLQSGISMLGMSAMHTAMGKAVSARSGLHADPVEAAKETVAKTNEAFQAQHDAQALGELGQAVKEAKLTTRLPEKIAELVNASHPDGEAAKVYFQADEWDSYWTKKGKSPAKAAEQILDDGGKGYVEAKESGAPLEIPLGKYVEKVAPTEDYEGLLQATRTTPDGMSFKEAREHIETLPATMADLAREATGQQAEPQATAAASAKTIGDKVVEQLKAAGLDDKTAKTNAKLYESAFRSLGERLGVDPQKVFDQYDLRIKKLEQEQANAPVLSDEERVLNQGPNDKAPPKRSILFPVKQDGDTFVVEPRDDMKATAKMEGDSMVMKDMTYHDKYQGVMQDMVRTLEKQAAAAGAKTFTAETSDPKQMEAYKAQGYTVTDSGDGKFTVSKDLSKVLKQSDLGFYSKLEQTVTDKMGNSATVEQVKALLKDVKEEERKWSGIDEFLKGKEKISKADLLDFLRANQLEIKEVTHTENQTQFSKYTLPGGENYREVLLTLPEKLTEAQPKLTELPEGYTAEQFTPKLTFGDQGPKSYWKVTGPDGENVTLGGFDTEAKAVEKALEKLNLSRTAKPTPGANYDSSHFSEANILAHVRLKDRVDADGKKVLFVEEIQSDWHQAGRKKGYRDGSENNLPEGYSYKFDETKKTKELQHQIIDPDGRIAGMGPNREAAIADFSRVSVRDGKVPDGPFKKTWHEFALKRVLKMAAEGGYDRVAWTTGEQQAERFDLSKQVDGISYRKDGKDTYEISAHKDGSTVVQKHGQTVDQLEDVVGKDIAKKIAGGEGKRTWVGSEAVFELKGVDLKVGGEGMKGFYDQIVPSFLNKFTKKFGGKVGETSIDDGVKVHSLDITPELKNAALTEGFSLFQEGRGQIRFGSDRKFNIELLKNADPSTFIHETGHFYLEVLGDAVDSKEATSQLKQDYQTILDWLGAKNRSEITVEQHEQWARGFEAYLMEGKAPSQALRQAFSRFKVWLTSVYRNLRNLNVELTPEVHDVMSRLLATDEEINHAENNTKFEPLFVDPKEMGMSDGQAAKYIEAREEARMAAEDIVRKKLMADHQRSERQFYKEKRKGVESEVRSELENSRPYKALDVLQTKDLKISESSLKDLGIKNAPRGIKSADGVHVEIAAEMLGYQSGRQMMEELSKIPKLSDATKIETDRRMAEFYPDSLTDGTISETAVKALHNEKRTQVLRMELEHLASNNMPVLKDAIRRVARRVPPQKLVREQAVGTIASKKVGELRPDLFLAAERRSAKEAGEALAKGDIDSAFAAKKRELLNNELYRAATEAKDNVEKQVKSFKKLFKADADLSKSRDVDMVNAGRAILAEFGIMKSEKTADEYLSKMKAYDPDTYETISALVESATQTPGPYKKSSYEDFVAMSDAVSALWDLSKTSREIEIDGQKVDRIQVTDKLKAHISDQTPAGPRAGYEKAMTAWEGTKVTLMSWRAACRRVESWVTAMDRSTKGDFRSIIWNPITEAAAKFRLAKQEVMRSYLNDVVKPAADIFHQKEILAPEIGYTFKNKGQLLGALLHTGNESNFSKLLRGRNWGSVDEAGNIDSSQWQKMIDRFHKDGTLTKADYDYVQGVWDLYEKTKADAQKAHKEMYGYYFNEITSKQVSTPFGEYRGGYAPAIADPTMAEDAAIRADKEQLEKNNNSFMFPTAGRGFTKSRVEAYAAPLAIDLEYVPMQIDKVLRFTHLEPSVKQVARIINDKSFRQTLSGLDPVVASEMLIPWLQRSAQQQTSTPSQGKAWKGLDWVMRQARKNTGLNAMAGNIVNVLHQTTGLSMALVRVEPSHFRDALWSYVKDAKGTADMMHEKSEYMRAHESDVQKTQAEINKLISQPGAYDTVKAFTEQNAYILQKLTAGMVEKVTWLGAYSQSVEKGMTEREAVRYADSSVRETQHASKPEEVSRFGTGSPFLRAFTMYFDYYNMKANLLGTEAANTYREMGMLKGLPRLTYLYATGFMIPAVMASAFYKAASGKLDENDDHQYMDDVVKLFFGSQVNEGLALVPVLGPITNNFINRFNDNKMDDRISMSPVMKNLERVLGTPKEVLDIAKGKGSPSAAIRDSLSLLGLMTGLPFEPLARPIGYMADVNSGKAKPTGPVDFTRGLMTGRPGK